MDTDGPNEADVQLYLSAGANVPVAKYSDTLP